MTGKSKIREGRDTLAVMNLVEVVGTLGASAKRKMMIIGAPTIMILRAVSTLEEQPTADPTGRAPSAGNTGSQRKTRAMNSITIRCPMETRQPTTSPATASTVTARLDGENPSRTPLRENLPVTVATRRTWSTTATTRADHPSENIEAGPLVGKSRSLGSPSQAATNRHTLTGAKTNFPKENGLVSPVVRSDCQY